MLPELAPEPPDTPFPSGAPYWYGLGGRPALDLVNTLRERWNRRIECLVDDRDVVAWLVAADLLGDPQAAPRGLARDARELREAIDAAMRAAVEQAPAPPDAIETIDDWLVLAGSRPRLLVASDGLPALGERAAADSPRRALGMVALDAAEMLADPLQRSRLRICAGETCSARFFDRSPAGRRQWCSMRACGNVAKARRHRERSRAE